MAYNVLSGTLNPTQSQSQSLTDFPAVDRDRSMICWWEMLIGHSWKRAFDRRRRKYN